MSPQLLGFLEVYRREGPRERNFLDEGSLAGSDTLFTLLEGMRCAGIGYDNPHPYKAAKR